MSKPKRGAAGPRSAAKECSPSEAETARLASFPVLNPNPVVEVDLQGRVLFANPACRQLFPDLEEAGAGHPWLSDWAAVADSCSPEGGRLPDREIRVGARWYRQAMHFVPELASVRVYGLDVTDQRQSAAELDAIFRALPFLVSLHGRDGSYLRANPTVKELFGVDPTGARREELAERLRARFPDGHPLTPENMPSTRALAGEEVHGVEYVVTDARGDDRALVFHAIPLKVGGEVEGAVFAQVDVTERKRVEQSLRESEATLRGILDATKESICLFDTDGVILLGNETALERLGRPAAEVIGRDFREAIPAHLVPGREEKLRQVVESGRSVQFEDERDGILFDHSFYPVFGADGRVARVAAVSRDVTGHVRAERELRRKGAELEAARADADRERLRLEAVLSALPVGVAITDAAGGSVRVNDGYEQIWRGPRPAVRSVDDYGAYRAWWGETGEPLAPEEWASARAIREGIQVAGQLLEIERFDGSRAFVLNSAAPVRDADGTIVGSAVAIQDITELRRSEEALRQSEQRLRFHMENSPVAVIEWDANFLVTRWAGEAERMFGWSEGEAIGKAIADLQLIFGDDIPIVKDVVARLTDGVTRRVAATNRNVTKDGRIIHCEWYNSVLVGPDGGMASVLSLVLDVTDRTRYERDLVLARDAAEAANRAKSEFLAMMSHEIRTPMNGILGMTELALMETPSRKVREYLGLAKASAKHLLDLINDVLDLSKIEAGRAELQEEVFDLPAAVGAVLAPLEVLARRKGLEFGYSADAHVPQRVRGDCGRLGQVLVNVVGNAVKFTDQGGVSVSLSLADRAGRTDRKVRLHFAVSDTGIGVPADRTNAIFESFTQASTSHHARYGGTGLGLAISRQLVELMGGRIWVEDRPGGGSTFRLEVEVGHEEEREPAERTLSDGAEPGNARPLRVLLAEDNPINQVLGQALLEGDGHSVVLAADGRKALEALGRERFDVVLMDVQMPEIDGLEATRAVRRGEVPGCPRDLPIVALTAHAILGDRERFLKVGMSDYLSKPLDFEALRRVLAEVAGSRAATP